MKKIDLENYRAIFFDFDGVIANTELLHFKSFNEVLKKFDIKISKSEYFKDYLAYDDKGCFKKLFLVKKNKNLSNEEIKKLITEKNKIFMKKIENEGFNFFEDTLKFIDYVRKFKNINLCIVSGALKREITYILKKLGIKDTFKLIISAEDVKNGKPSPEPFLLAKNKLQELIGQKLNDKEILVIEDSINGIKAAKVAGFVTVAVAHTYPLRKLKSIKPDIAVRKLTDLFRDK